MNLYHYQLLSFLHKDVDLKISPLIFSTLDSYITWSSFIASCDVVLNRIETQNRYVGYYLNSEKKYTYIYTAGFKDMLDAIEFNTKQLKANNSYFEKMI